MFTGIITDIGTVTEIEQRGDIRFRIQTSYEADKIDIGASIASNGVCLTVVEKGTSSDNTYFYEVDVSAETLSKTDLGKWQIGSKVNLERSLKLGDEMGGHLVSGHVDGTAIITDMSDDGASTRFTFEAPQHLAPFIAAKGSVALNGTSLTVNTVEGVFFTVNMIPHTKAVTTWGKAKQGDIVNLEIDTLARYVARLNEFQQS
ncbi:MAG: riboflavin synthase [Pseudomonadota bacterium]